MMTPAAKSSIRVAIVVLADALDHLNGIEYTKTAMIMQQLCRLIGIDADNIAEMVQVITDKKFRIEAQSDAAEFDRTMADASRLSAEAGNA